MHFLSIQLTDSLFPYLSFLLHLSFHVIFSSPEPAQVPKGAIATLHLAHTGRPDLLGDIEHRIREGLSAKGCQLQSVLCICVGPALGVHLGVGAYPNTER